MMKYAGVVVVMVVLILGLCATPAHAVMMVGAYPACDGSPHAILECVKFIFDLNHDNVITPEEIDARFVMNITGVPGPFQDPQIIKNCDVDGDGNLTMSDWDSPNRTCLIYPGTTTIACNVCELNGFVMTPPDYFVQPNKRSDEPRHVRFTDKQLQDHRKEELVQANLFKKAAIERLERHAMLEERFKNLKKWKQKQMAEEAFHKHMELTDKYIADKKKRLIGA